MYEPSLDWQFQVRNEWVMKEVEKYGFLHYGQVKWKPSQNWQFEWRYTLHDISSYEERIYAMERDALWLNKFYLYQGKGVSLSLLIRKKWRLKNDQQ